MKDTKFFAILWFYQILSTLVVQSKHNNSVFRVPNDREHDFASADLSNVVGFWNIYAEGPSFEEIVSQQREVIKSSGLLDRVRTIFYVTLGKNETNFTMSGCKFHHALHKNIGSEVETLTLIHSYCKNNTNSKVFYFHNKGSFHHSLANENFRFSLDCFVLNPHCIAALDEYDTCGLRISPFPFIHYSGNFWWATCKHVNGLVDPMSQIRNKTFIALTASLLPHSEAKSIPDIGLWDSDAANVLGIGRYFAEAWVGSAPSFKPADCLHQDADLSYLFGYDLPMHLINGLCPHNSSQQEYGMQCGPASTFVAAGRFAGSMDDIVAVMQSVMGNISFEQLITKLVQRSVYWYGQVPTTLLAWISMWKLVDAKDIAQLQAAKGPAAPFFEFASLPVPPRSTMKSDAHILRHMKAIESVIAATLPVVVMGLLCACLIHHRLSLGRLCVTSRLSTTHRLRTQSQA